MEKILDFEKLFAMDLKTSPTPIEEMEDEPDHEQEMEKEVEEAEPETFSDMSPIGIGEDSFKEIMEYNFDFSDSFDERGPGMETVGGPEKAEKDALLELVAEYIRLKQRMEQEEKQLFSIRRKIESLFQNGSSERVQGSWGRLEGKKIPSGGFRIDISMEW